jgi:transcriptional regulator with XRE-family HTH domain
MLGMRVRRAREAADMTQEQLAVAAGLKQWHISRIESGGIKDVKGETLVRLARALNVTTDYLLGLEEEEGTELQPAGVVMVGSLSPRRQYDVVADATAL